MTNLILHVTPELQVLEGALKVAFFDKEIIKYKYNEDVDAPKEEVSRAMTLCIRIENKEDVYSIIERPAKRLRLKDQVRGVYFKDEKEIYKNAYAKYLELKNKVVYDPSAELEVARKRIAELEAKANAPVIEEEPKKKGRPFSKTEITE